MDHVINGKKCTVFCYGPTGSGKTFTAFGPQDNLGILARTIQLALKTKANKLDEMNIHKDIKNYKCEIKLSSLEIYNEKAYDLLSIDNQFNKGLPVRSIGNGEVVVQGLTMVYLYYMYLFTYLCTVCDRK